MSAAVAFRHPSLGPDWFTDSSDGAWVSSSNLPQGHRQTTTAARSRSSQCGLPASLDRSTMTGVTFDSQYPPAQSTQAYPSLRIPLHSGSHNDYSGQNHHRTSQPDTMQSRRGSIDSGSTAVGGQGWEGHPDKSISNSIASYLQIPESVNKSKGSLAEFAAEITCLFWFETATTLQFAEEIPNASYIDRGLAPDSIPSTGFRKWVTTILSTTQVGKNVILLALMFIYRLKKFNPAVSGKRGSEFRLLTIALMLGNKFLDDNTYTNKTWAEVSGIAVTEIHIMEVEFLSNMRYDLYVSEAEWLDWKVRLGRFGLYYERALQVAQESSRATLPVTPTMQSFPHKLPSPSSTHHNVSPTSRSMASSSNGTLAHSTAASPHVPRSPMRQYRNPVLEQLDRKRSMDFSNEAPPPKRMYQPSSSISPRSSLSTPISATTPGSVGAVAPSSAPYYYPELGDRVPRLPMPRVQTGNLHGNAQLAPISYPTPRAMSTVYPNTTETWPQPITPVSAVSGPAGKIYQTPIPSLNDQHPRSSTQPSPSYGMVTPGRHGLSPSVFLAHRSSPYRPVRGVNTLLIPPPAASMTNLPRNVALEQIHYQPLSKAAADVRMGPVPYLQPDAWQQSNASTPLALQQYAYRP